MWYHYELSSCLLTNSNCFQSPVFSLSRMDRLPKCLYYQPSETTFTSITKEMFWLYTEIFENFYRFLFFVILRWEQMSERTGSRSFWRIHEYLWVKRSVVLQSFQLFTSFFFGKRKQTRNSLWQFDRLYTNHPSKNPSKKIYV